MKIGFSGTQSAGKTTLFNKLIENLFVGSRFEFITELTRTLKARGFDINEAGNDKTQLEIMKLHQEVCSKKEDVIVDRTCLDGMVYSKYLFNHGNISKDTLDKVTKTFESLIDKYDLIIYIKPEFDPVDDGVRSVSLAFRDEIFKLFEETIKEYNLKVFTVTGTVEERMNQIYKKFDELNIQY